MIRETTGLTASAGVAPNKFLAKIASGWQKPDGLTVIPPERVEEFLQQLPVDALWGVGPVTAKKLREAGITRLVDVRRVETDSLRKIVGSLAEWLQQLARGEDPREVEPHRPAKSASSENTYAADLTDLERMRAELAGMAGELAGWLERHELLARTVTIKVRYADFRTVTRSHTLSQPTAEGGRIAAWSSELLERTEAGARPVRLLGVGVHGLVQRDPAGTMRRA
jgi:DNA polymerase-4